jgi:F-box-like
MSPAQLPPQLPPELSFKIIDSLEDDHSSLKAASLVCKIWQHHAQQHLFQTFTLTMEPHDRTTHLLKELGSDSASHVRECIKHLVMVFWTEEYVFGAPQPWLCDSSVVVVEVLNKLPLEKLVSFTLKNGWVPASAVYDHESFRLLPLPGVMRCIQDICAAPQLEALTIVGHAQFPQLLSCCGVSLKELNVAEVGGFEWLWGANMRREAPIELETLVLEKNRSRGDTMAAEALLDGLGGISEYLLDPRSLFTLKSLKVLIIESNELFDRHLLQMLSPCLDSLKALVLRTSCKSP